MDEARLKAVAKGAIEDLANEESAMFDAQWQDAMKDMALLDPPTDRRDRHLGAGSAMELSLMGVIVIPLVVAIGREIASATAKEIAARARKFLSDKKEKERLPLTDEEIDRIAIAVAARFTQARTS